MERFMNKEKKEKLNNTPIFDYESAIMNAFIDRMNDVNGYSVSKERLKWAMKLTS